MGTQIHTAPEAFGKVMSRIKPRMAVAYHFFNDFDTSSSIYERIRSTYEGPLSLAEDYMVWNFSKDGIFGTVPPQDHREELTPWLVDGILEMEDVIKAYYERQGVGELYEQQLPKK